MNQTKGKIYQNLIVALLSFAFLQCVNDKTKEEVFADKIINVIETKNFGEVVELVHKLKYTVSDSSTGDGGAFIYFAKEVTSTGNTLWYIRRINGDVEEVGFSTYNQTTFNEIRSELINKGFVSIALDKDKFAQAEEFKRNNVYISTSSEKKENGLVRHEVAGAKKID